MVEMEDIRGVRLRKFNLRKIILEVRMHFRQTSISLGSNPTSGCIICVGKLVHNHLDQYFAD